MPKKWEKLVDALEADGASPWLSFLLRYRANTWDHPEVMGSPGQGQLNLA